MENEILTIATTIVALALSVILICKNLFKQQPIKIELSMTLEETEEAITVWINSCQNEQQLNLCRDAIDQFVFQRYKNHAPGQQAIQAMSRLTALIGNRQVALLIK